MKHDWRPPKAFLYLPQLVRWYSGYDGWLMISRLWVHLTSLFNFEGFFCHLITCVWFDYRSTSSAQNWEQKVEYTRLGLKPVLRGWLVGDKVDWKIVSIIDRILFLRLSLLAFVGISRIWKLWNGAWNDPIEIFCYRHTFLLWPYMVSCGALRPPGKLVMLDHKPIRD